LIALGFCVGLSAQAATMADDVASAAGASALPARAQSGSRRWELLPELATVVGGDSYLKTDFVGFGVEVMIAPRLSLGLDYAYAFNSLKPEGEAWLSEPRGRGEDEELTLDFPKSQLLVLANWTPLSGRLHLGDTEERPGGNALRFDIYALVGAGRLFLHSGSTAISTLGGGVKIWGSSRMTVRMELRSQPYMTRRPEGVARVESLIGGLRIGYRL
jgi:hypothetical protein